MPGKRLTGEGGAAGFAVDRLVGINGVLDETLHELAHVHALAGGAHARLRAISPRVRSGAELLRACLPFVDMARRRASAASRLLEVEFALLIIFCSSASCIVRRVGQSGACVLVSGTAPRS